MPLDRLRLLSAKARLWRWLLDEVVHAPLEPILHPSRARLQYLGAFTILGHIAFGWIWIALLPQPYENMATRLAMSSLGIPLLIGVINRDLTSQATIWIFSMACWLQLPMFFSLMYWFNGGNDVWLASMACMVVIYYHLTDWRLATLGTVAGVVVSLLLAKAMQVPLSTEATHADHLVVLAFAWGAAVMLGASSANLRRTRLINTLSTMGVMAHELRTPLATVNLMGDVLRNLSQHDVGDHKRKKFEDLATRLQNLVRSMNRQIDTQISNAQIMRLPREQSPVIADATLQLDQRWSLFAETQWNSEQNRREQNGLRVGYSDRSRLYLHAGYQYRPIDDIRQTELAAMVPVHRNWSLIGRWLHDLGERRSLETISGLEYRDCCWRIRLINLRELSDRDGDTTLDAERTTLLQIQMVGLGGFGGTVDTLLERGIPGYRRTP